MAVLPTKILTDEKISEFVSDVNRNAEKIIGDSKFKIPSPDLPGLGMIIKLWIRSSEKSFSSYLAPVIIVKDVLNNPLKIPEKIGDIKGFVQNPLQALLDETLNPQIDDELFLPLKLKIGGAPSADFSNLSSLVERAELEDLSAVPASSNPFPYVLGITGSPPQRGEYSFRGGISSGEEIISINVIDSSGTDTSSSFTSLIIGDQISISRNGISQTWIIKNIVRNSDYYSLSVTLKNKSVQQVAGQIAEETAYVKVFQDPQNSGKSALRSLIVGPDGKIKFPIAISLPQILSIVGINVPASPLSSVFVELGDFNVLPEDSPLRKKIKDLEVRSGWNFQNDVLNPMLNSEYPVINWKTEDQKTEKDRAREEILSLAKLFDLLVNNTALFFKILANYLKLLLLPIQIVIGTITGVFSRVISNPLQIFRIITLLLTDPLKLLGELIADAILEQIRPYLEPSLKAANIDWETEVKEEKISGALTGKGLKPLLRDVIIGRFKCANLNNPDGSKILNSSDPGQGLQNNSNESTIQFTNYSYFFKYDGVNPENGEVSFNSEDLNRVTSIKISTFDSNVTSTLPALVNLLPGSEISVPKENQIWVYKINKTSPSPGSLTYYEYNVSLLYGPDTKNTQGILTGSSNTAVLSPGADNQNVRFTSTSPFLVCLIENYLPIKVIAIWESVKGILGVILGFAITVPSLLKAIITSIFSSNSEFSNPGVFTLENLTELPTDSALVNQDVIKGDTLDIISYKTSENTKEFVDQLTDVGGIEAVIQLQAKKSGLSQIRKVSENFQVFFTDSITVSDFSLRYKSLLSLYVEYTRSGSLNGTNVKIKTLKGEGVEETVVTLNQAGINSVKFSLSDFDPNSKDKNISDVVRFIRDNLYLAKELLKAQPL